MSEFNKLSELTGEQKNSLISEHVGVARSYTTDQNAIYAAYNGLNDDHKSIFLQKLIDLSENAEEVAMMSSVSVKVDAYLLTFGLADSDQAFWFPS